MSLGDRLSLGLRASAARRGLIGHGAAFLLAAGVGIFAGAGALLFRRAEIWIHDFALGGGASVVEAVEGFPWWQRLLLPGIGILAAALLVRRIPGTRGGKGPDVMEAVVLRRGPVRLGPELLRVGGALSVLGTGGSVGPEGPIVELGAAVGSQTALFFRDRRRTIQLLTACGSAAGLAAAFNAPIGAAVFVLEILMMGRFSLDRFAPVVVASVSATMVTWAVQGTEPVFKASALTLRSAWEILPAILLAVIAGIAGAVFLRVLEVVPASMARWRMPFWARALVGGAAVAAMGLFYPQVLGSGFEGVNAFLRLDALTPFAAAVFLMAWIKMLATGVTLGAGGLGGAFAPTLFVGAALGGAFGCVVNGLFPGSGPPGAYALIGMAALVGATLHAPVTAILLLFELSRDYPLVPPLMVAAVTGTLISRRLHPWSLYLGRLRGAGFRSTGGHAEMRLRGVAVTAAMEPPAAVVDRTAPVSEVLRRIEERPGSEVLVVDRGGRICGRVRPGDLAGIAAGSLGRVAVAGDLSRPAPSVPSAASLAEALEVLDFHGLDEVAVVEGVREGGRLLGVVSRRSILRRLRSDD